MDPVTLGLASQIDLDFEVQRAAKDKPAQPQRPRWPALLPAEVSTAPTPRAGSFRESEPARRPAQNEKIDVDSVFAKLKQLRQPTRIGVNRDRFRAAP
jgi:hypothetical protein